MMHFLSRRRREKDAAQRLYATCLQAAREPSLFTEFEVADSLQGRFEMLTLHLFPVLHRLMHVPGDDPDLARLLSETFVDDMDSALREAGVSDVAVPRRMKTLYQSFAGRIAAYKTALEAGPGELAAAIARNVFPDHGGEGAVPERAMDLATYLRSASEAVAAVGLAELRRGEVPFPPVPNRREMGQTT